MRTYSNNSFKTFSSSLAGFVLSLSGCAGPTTPLGAIWSLTPVGQIRPASANSGQPGSSKAAIRFLPEQQVLHGASQLQLIIENMESAETLENHLSDERLRILYNGFDVTRTFLRQARISGNHDEKRIRIEVPSIRLSPSDDHSIEVLYRTSTGVAYAKLDPPLCDAFLPSPVHNLAGFRPHPRIVEAIDRISTNAGINPAFLTGLVAQESGFNPRVVSWARALGLTQITPIAESEFIRRYQNWPRYPGINDLPFPVLKALVVTGTINARNEWRLDPERSVQGGVEYIGMLANLWSAPEHLLRIKRLFSETEVARTRLILASYHSGYSRVGLALQRRGTDWINAPDLKEGKKYVNRIMSYCSAFAKDRGKYEDSSKNPDVSCTFPCHHRDLSSAPNHPPLWR